MPGTPGTVDEAMLAAMRCPRDFSGLRRDGDGLCCEAGHAYPVVDGIPIMLLPEANETLWVAAKSIQAAGRPDWAPLYLEATNELTARARAAIAHDHHSARDSGAKIDIVISHLLAATCGHGYARLVGRLAEYPIPDIPLAPGRGRRLLDVGSNWGRWSVSAARKGWRVVALYPSLGALLAAKRAFAKEGLDIGFVCGDARYLPFPVGSFGPSNPIPSSSTSPSRMPRPRSPRWAGRFARGESRRSRWRTAASANRPFPAPDDQGTFGVRFWKLSRLREVFGREIGPTTVSAEAFGGLGLLREDFRHVRAAAKLLIAGCSLLRAASRLVPAMSALADSVFVTAVKD